MEHRSRVATLAGVPCLYLLLLFLLPLVIMAIYSFRGGISGDAYHTFTLENYQAFLRLLWTSSLIALAIALISTLLAYPLRNALDDDGLRGRVKEVVYIGTDTRYIVALKIGREVIVRQQNRTATDVGGLQKGDAVYVQWQRDYGRVLVQ